MDLRDASASKNFLLLLLLLLLAKLTLVKKNFLLLAKLTLVKDLSDPSNYTHCIQFKCIIFAKFINVSIGSVFFTNYRQIASHVFSFASIAIKNFNFKSSRRVASCLRPSPFWVDRRWWRTGQTLWGGQISSLCKYINWISIFFKKYLHCWDHPELAVRLIKILMIFPKLRNSFFIYL